MNKWYLLGGGLGFNNLKKTTFQIWNQSQCNGWRKQWLHSQATNLHRENVEMWLFLTYQKTTKTKTRCWWLTISTKAPFSLRSYLPEAYIVLVDWQLSINTSQETSSFLKNLNLLVDQGPKEAAKKYSQYHGMTTSLSTFWVQCTAPTTQDIPHRSKERLEGEAREEQLLYAHAHHYCMTMTSTCVGLTMQIRITVTIVLDGNASVGHPQCFTSEKLQ